MVSLMANGSADNVTDRDKRSVQFLFEGIIDALTQKHLKSTANTKILPFAGYTKQGLLSSGNIDLIDRTSMKSSATLSPAVTQMPLIKANNSDTIMMMNGTQSSTDRSAKIMLPVVDDSMVTSTTTISSTGVPMTTGATMKAITPPANEPEPSVEPPAMLTARNMADEEMGNMARDMGGATAPAAAGEERSAKVVRADADSDQPQSKFNYQPTQIVSDRHTQFWGNPLYFQTQYPQIIPFGPIYNELVYNGVDAIPPPPPPPPPLRPLPPFPLLPTVLPKFGRYYLPPVPGSPVFVMPLPIPPPSIFFRNADNSHSRVKMHNSDYHQYVYHGTEPIAAQEPVVPNAVAAEPDHHNGQSTVVRRTYIDPYASININPHVTNLIAAQSQVMPQIQSSQSTVTPYRQTPNDRPTNVRSKPNQKTRPSSRIRDSSPPTSQNQTALQNLQRGLRTYQPAQISSTSLPNAYSQTQVQFFGRKINGNQ